MNNFLFGVKRFMIVILFYFVSCSCEKRRKLKAGWNQWQREHQSANSTRLFIVS